LMARAACADADPKYKNTTAYTYGDKVAAVHADDKYRRQLYSSTIALRN